MATGLYETLEIPSDASPEQIRRAYKRKALQNHPDRLPQNVSAAEKASAAERFRLANNAYEVLSDPEKRKAYDTHGVWPPQNPPPDQPRGNYNGRNDHFPSGATFSDPFFSSPFRRPNRHTPFTDPFVLFNSLFGDIFNEHLAQFDDIGRHSRHTRFNADPFYSMAPSGFGPMFNEGFSGHHRGGGHAQMMRSSFQSSFVNTGQNPRWVSESRMTRSVNGVTESVHERRDSDGNIHVTVKHPDGRKTYTINGVEQPSVEAIEAPPSNNHHRSHGHNHRSGRHYVDPNASGQHWGW